MVPDDIGVHSFEPELTAEEVAEGTSYWTAVTAGNVDDEVRSAAWVKILGRARRSASGMDRRDDASDRTPDGRRAAAARRADEGVGVDEGCELPRAP